MLVLTASIMMLKEHKIMKPHLLKTLLIAGFLPSLSWGSHTPIVQNFDDQKSTLIDLIAEDFQLTLNTDIEKIFLSKQPLVLSLPNAIMGQYFAIDFETALSVFSTTPKSDLLLGAHFSFSPEDLKIRDIYFGLGIPLGQFKYGILSTLQNNPLTGFWKGHGANSSQIYERFDAPLKNSLAFESANWHGFSFRAIQGTSGYLTGIKNNLEATISDIPAIGGSIQYQQGGLLVRYTTLTKEQSISNDIANNAPPPNHRRAIELPTPSTQPEPPQTTPGDSTANKNTTNYKQKRVKVAYNQNNLSLCVGYQYITSKEGWGDVSSVAPFSLSQETTKEFQDVVEKFNNLRQEPNVTITWPNFKTHEILASASYIVGKVKPKISFVYGKIDEKSIRDIAIDFSQCTSFICYAAKSLLGKTSKSQQIPMPNYKQYLIGIDYLLSPQTTLGASFGQINWDNDIVIPEIGEWQNRQSIGLHVSHIF